MKAESHHPYMCVCGHSIQYHGSDVFVRKKGKKHPCFMEGCPCKDFSFLVVIHPVPLKQAIAECRKVAFEFPAYQSGQRLPEESRRKRGMKTMLSAKKAIMSRGEGGVLLKGSMVPMKQKEIEIKIIGVREAPENFAAAIICDIEEAYEAQAWAPNKTCLKLLASSIKSDDLEELVGATVKLSIVMARNPKAGGALVRSFQVSGVKLAGSRKMVEISEDSVPF